jgi:hypothetical protein
LPIVGFDLIAEVYFRAAEMSVVVIQQSAFSNQHFSDPIQGL